MTTRNMLSSSSMLDNSWSSATLKRLLEGGDSDDIVVRSRPFTELISNGCLRLIQATNMETVFKYADMSSMIPHIGSVLQSRDVRSGIALLTVSSSVSARLRYLRLFRINVSMANMSRTLKVQEIGGFTRLRVLDLMVFDILVSSKDLFPAEVIQNILNLAQEHLQSYDER